MISVFGFDKSIKECPAGHVLTNAHVVEGCRVIQAVAASLVETTGMSVEPKPRAPFGNRLLMIAAIDAANDLAILGSGVPVESPATFRLEPDTRTGETIVVAGFPLPGALPVSSGSRQPPNRR